MRRPLPANAFDQAGLELHCLSFFKLLAPGYREGGAAAGRFARDAVRLKVTTSLASPIPSQLAIAKRLVQGGLERHLRSALKSQYTADRALIERCYPKGTRLAAISFGGSFPRVFMPCPSITWPWSSPSAQHLVSCSLPTGGLLGICDSM